QAAEEANGEPAPSLTVGGVGELQLAEMAEFAYGGVAVEDLLQEEVGSDDGGEGASSEAEFQVGADLFDEPLGQNLGAIALETVDCFDHSKHSRSLLDVMLSDNRIIPGGSCLLPKYLQQNHLRLT